MFNWSLYSIHFDQSDRLHYDLKKKFATSVIHCIRMKSLVGLNLLGG